MPVPVLKKHYQDVIIAEMKKLHGYENVHVVPCLEKIVINSGFDANIDKKEIASTQKDISAITGQHSVITIARKSVSNFKLREGMPVGTMVTLRGAAMYEFLYRLIAVALPGIRDFRGVQEKLDGSGNYNLGIADHTIFAEINTDGSKRTIGMDISFVTSAKTDAEGRDLLRLFGMPFRKKQSSTATAA